MGSPLGTSRSSLIDREAIVAIGTAPGDGARAMVRISGHGVLAGMSPLVSGPAGELLARGARGVAAGRLSIESDTGSPGLPVLVAAAPGPRSFTGEDVLEVQVPGQFRLATSIRDRIVRHLDETGVPARPAAAGEFSARAFLAGRLSASEAVGIALAIEADRDEDLRQASRFQEESGGDRISVVRARLIGLVARLEAGIDFTDEEDVVACTTGECRSACGSTLDELDAIRHSLDAVGGAIEAAPGVVLTGPPNAGKSTLYNALVGSPRAVVAEIPGTTRDAVETMVRWSDPTGLAPDAVLTLVDTAGIGDSVDALDAAATNAGRRAIESAAVVVVCRPIDAPDSEDAPEAWTVGTGNATVVEVRTKADLQRARGTDEPDDAIVVSAHTGHGLDRLRAQIRRAIDAAAGGRGSNLRPALIARLVRGLDVAFEHVRTVVDSVADREPSAGVPMPEVMAATLRVAIDALSELEGDLDPDRVLDEVFARFCIGK